MKSIINIINIIMSLFKLPYVVGGILIIFRPKGEKAIVSFDQRTGAL